LPLFAAAISFNTNTIASRKKSRINFKIDYEY